jgi:hypothetical protein
MANKSQFSLPETRWMTTAGIHMAVVMGLLWLHSPLAPCRMEAGWKTRHIEVSILDKPKMGGMFI